MIPKPKPLCSCGNEAWWLTDCKGIPLKLVCDDCVEEVEKEYNPWVFSGYSQEFLDEYSGEQIEPDY